MTQKKGRKGLAGFVTIMHTNGFRCRFWITVVKVFCIQVAVSFLHLSLHYVCAQWLCFILLEVRAHGWFLPS